MKLYICLEISVLGYRWRIAMIVVEIAWGLGKIETNLLLIVIEYDYI